MARTLELEPLELTETEAAKILNIKPNTLAAWRRDGKSPPYRKYQRTVRYPSDDLFAFRESLTVRPGQVTA